MGICSAVIHSFQERRPMVAKQTISPLDGATLAQLQDQKHALQERSRRQGTLGFVLKAIAMAIAMLAGASFYQRSAWQTTAASSYSSTDSYLPWQVHIST
jgi:hypothetical protein